LKKLLLFDIDGTLLRADDASRQAMNKTFCELFGIKNPEQNVPFIGRTDLGIFKDVALQLLGRPFRNGELQQMTDRYVLLLPVELERCESFCLMPGVESLLSFLYQRSDVVMGLETGNIEPAAYLKLKRGNIDHYFKFGGFGSDSADRAELIQKGIDRAYALENSIIPIENIYVIGDAPYDISAGKKIGVNTIAVGTGIGDQTKLIAEKPDYYLKNLVDIPAFLQCIGRNT
jgi:phosphoglycolate phosphatase